MFTKIYRFFFALKLVILYPEARSYPTIRRCLRFGREK